MQTDPLKEEKLELRVAGWLTEKGFLLIKRNWAYCHGKIDIIASRFGRLHFIGVTTKSYHPVNTISDEGITRRKMLSFLQASQQYLQRYPQWKDVMIDILTVTMIGEEPKDCTLTGNVKLT
ncbi:YraN family protein [Sediminibacterium soli]|uniref:YraN family protein n=1 Tax=Sediminibacterium soli TaxID=2698829 RepID=UPI00137961B7|nr:YraN family protein [Sediminibacterium soli]NCI46135.1 YraN family protein [Sediminibacterium soli]